MNDEWDAVLSALYFYVKSIIIEIYKFSFSMHQVEKLLLAHKGFVTVIDFINTAAREYFWIHNVPYISGVCVCIGRYRLMSTSKLLTRGSQFSDFLARKRAHLKAKNVRETQYVRG